MAGAELNPDVEAEIEISHDVEPSSGFEMGLGVQLTEPPYPLLEVGIIMSIVLPRDALLSAVYAVVVCVCLSVCVCVSVTLRYCIKTAKRRITQITPHDSPLTLVF